MAAIIGTWKMSYEGVAQAGGMLSDGVDAGDAVVHAITQVENDPAYSSVGYGGLPARDGRVLLDSAYMDGSTLRYGAILSAQGVKNPIKAARLLCGRQTNCLLAGQGAEEFCIAAGLEMRDMRTPESQRRWREAMQQQKDTEPLSAYRGHDTVCVLAVDNAGKMVAGTSTSGLFLKEPGRVGDSPIIGSGFYCDAEYGAAAATGLGEEIMRGCLSYEIVRLMREGTSPQTACETAVAGLLRRTRQLGNEDGSFSVIALSPGGEFGAATTLNIFPFAAAANGSCALYAAMSKGGYRAAAAQELEGEP